MHDYQIILETRERSVSNWKASAGSVYPTLQLLTDEGARLPRSPTGARSTHPPGLAGTKWRAVAAKRFETPLEDVTEIKITD